MIDVTTCPVCGHSYSTVVAGEFRCNLCLSHWRIDNGLEVTLHNEEGFNIDGVEHASIVPLDDGTPSFGDGRQCVDILFEDGCDACWVVDSIGIDARREDILVRVDVDKDTYYYFKVPAATVKASKLDYDETIAALVALTLSVKGIEPDSFC